MMRSKLGWLAAALLIGLAGWWWNAATPVDFAAPTKVDAAPRADVAEDERALVATNAPSKRESVAASSAAASSLSSGETQELPIELD
ncbi:MAG: hypothetical protein IT453_04250, partial [Planctomycetes bacterium]|nr:hypothetical protein [Planctomycetota bacterium]